MSVPLLLAAFIVTTAGHPGPVPAASGLALTTSTTSPTSTTSASGPTTATGPTTVSKASAAPTVFRNERGSELELVFHEGGRLGGTFRSGVGKVSAAQRFEVVGVYEGDVVAFTVNFAKAKTLGAWVGQRMGDTLVCLWHLAKDVPDDDEARELWGSVRTGSDVFELVPLGPSAP